MVYFPCKRLIAHILLLGQFLTSCGNPRYLHMGRIVSCRTSRSTSIPSTICRVSYASPRPIPLPQGATLHFEQKGSSCWALLESASAQPIDLPVRFEDGFTRAYLARSDPVWQAQYIHLHPASADSLEPSFIYIGPSAQSVEQPLDKVDSMAHLASSFTPSSASSACSYTFLKDPGYKIVLKPYGDRWQAIVHDNRFTGLSRSYTASVAFEKGYGLEDFISKDSVYQSRHIHLLSTNKDRPIVYIGSFGLKGGGCCGRATWRCACGFPCPNGRCEACCSHKPHCSIIEQQRQQQQQQELWNAQEKRSRLSKDQEASAQWEKEEQLRQAAQAAQESRISQELESVKSKRVSTYLEREKERRTRESIRQGIERENIKSRLRLQGDLLLHEKDISLTDSEAEEECELTTTTNKATSFDTNYYQLSEASTYRLFDEVCDS